MLINGPKYTKKSLEEIKIAIQINGKTRDILASKKGFRREGINRYYYKKFKS